MNTNADITLYNRWYNKATRLDEWKRVEIIGVNWHGGQMTTVGENGLLSADKYTVRIHAASAPAGRQYLPPEKYAALTADQLEGAWTLQAGDIVVRGRISDAEPPKAKDMTTRFVIIGVSDNSRGNLPHWKVVGT